MELRLGIIGSNYRNSDVIDVWFDSLQSIAAILSESNRELLQIIEKFQPESIQKLSMITGRQQGNLSRTLKTLKKYKIVELEKKGKALRPIVLANSFIIPISLEENNIFQTTKPKVVSLFSGCGGMDLGFHKAGFDIVFANDIEMAVKDTYERNIGAIKIQDILTIDKHKDIPKDIDVVLAGIPCQPFSNAGNRKAMGDDRGQLFLQVMEVVDIKKPKVVVFENVRGFVSAKDDTGIPMTQRLEEELEKHGYDTYWKLLNASDYEVPQNRLRVFIVGIRKDLNKKFKFPEPVTITKDNLTVGKVINTPAPTDEKEEYWELSPQAKKIIPFIPAGGSWKNIPDEYLPLRLKKIRNDMKKYRSPNFYRRFNDDEIMGTITAAATPENSGILHPHKQRRYTVREIARFQSFPDDFKFLGNSIAHKYRMIGNAVPPKLSYHLALAINLQIFND